MFKCCHVFRGSCNNVGVLKEPFVGPVMELFHENEVDDDIEEDNTTNQESLTVSSGSSRSSRESGVESMMDMEAIVVDDKDDIIVDDIVEPETNISEELNSAPQNGETGAENTNDRNDIDSPFEVFNTVYV